MHNLFKKKITSCAETLLRPRLDSSTFLRKTLSILTFPYPYYFSLSQNTLPSVSYSIFLELQCFYRQCKRTLIQSACDVPSHLEGPNITSSAVHCSSPQYGGGRGADAREAPFTTHENTKQREKRSTRAANRLDLVWVCTCRLCGFNQGIPSVIRAQKLCF